MISKFFLVNHRGKLTETNHILFNFCLMTCSLVVCWELFNQSDAWVWFHLICNQMSRYANLFVNLTLIFILHHTINSPLFTDFLSVLSGCCCVIRLDVFRGASIGSRAFFSLLSNTFRSSVQSGMTNCLIKLTST